MQSNEAKKLSQTSVSGGARANRDGALDDLPAGTELMRGQYTIESYLNSGGFGITYCASDSLGRTVVIKECFPTIMCKREGTKIAPRKIDYAVELSKLIEQFVSEAHALAALKHKNILHVHQVFEENDTAYMAIDFIDGPDLMDVIQTDPDRLTPEEILRLTRRTLGAIKYIHDKGMLHRDISPDNILIDEAGEPVLIDFGAALRSNAVPNRVFSKVKFVKDGYSPQEFYIEGSQQGTYSDIYGFAATIYHAISGAPPVDGQQRLSAVAQGQDDPYVPLAGTTDDYPDGFLGAIDTALAIMPVDRLQTADEWLELIPARPTRIVSKRAAMPSRRTRPTVDTAHAKTRLLADSLAPLDVLEASKSTAADAVPDDETAAPLALAMETDEPDGSDIEDDLYFDEEDETPVDLRALMPAQAIASKSLSEPVTDNHQSKSAPDIDRTAEAEPSETRTDRDALPEDDSDGYALTLDLEPEIEVEREDDLASAGSDQAVGTDRTVPSDPPVDDGFGDNQEHALGDTEDKVEDWDHDDAQDNDDALDPLETAIAETTQSADLSLEKRISRIVTEAIEKEDAPIANESEPSDVSDLGNDPEQEPEDDLATLQMDRPDPDEAATVAALRPTGRSSQGKIVMGGVAAALLVIAGVGTATFMRGSDGATQATTSNATAPQASATSTVDQAAETEQSTDAPSLVAAPVPDQNPSPPEIAPSLAAEAASPAPTVPPTLRPIPRPTSAPALVPNDIAPPAVTVADVPDALPQQEAQSTVPGLPRTDTQPSVSAGAPLSLIASNELAFRPNVSAEPPSIISSAPSGTTALDPGTLATAPIVAIAALDTDLTQNPAPELSGIRTDSMFGPEAPVTRPQTQQNTNATGVFEFDLNAATATAPVLTVADEAARAVPLDVLENSVSVAGIRPNVDVTPPAPLARTPVATNQVVGAHWDVAMPFGTEVERVRNANTARITEVSDPAVAQISGPWVAEGTVIFSLNGENLRPGVPLSTHLLDTLVVDPDGYTRASVRYRDATTGRLDLGLLTIPVVRDISLADDTRITYRVIDGRWVMVVTSPGPLRADGLRVGDILVAEETTGIGIANEDALRAAFASLVADGTVIARFRVERDGAEQSVRVPLTRERQP